MTVEISPKLLNFVRPSEHSLFSPSAGDRWMKCHYSINGSKGLPNKSSVWAEAGTLAHSVCEDYANHYLFDEEKTAILMGASDENMRSAEGWVNVLETWLARTDDIGSVLYFGLETGLPIFPDRGCFGTADAIVVGTKGCAAIDFKNGVGHIVGARSTQLQIYLLAFFNYLENIPEDYKFHSVVYQPRVTDLPKEATYSFDEMQEFHDSVDAAIDKALAGDNAPVLGSHCHWCLARTTNNVDRKCPAQKQKDIDFAHQSFESYLVDIDTPVVDNEINVKRDAALLKIMALLPLMNKIGKDADAEFLDRMSKGEVIDGLALADKMGNRKWISDDADMANRIKTIYGIEPTIEMKPKLKTITQVEKEVGKKNFDNSLTKKNITKKVVLSDVNVKVIMGELADYAAAQIGPV